MCRVPGYETCQMLQVYLQRNLVSGPWNVGVVSKIQLLVSHQHIGPLTVVIDTSYTYRICSIFDQEVKPKAISKKPDHRYTHIQHKKSDFYSLIQKDQSEARSHCSLQNDIRFLRGVHSGEG